mmetsp:Transcript_90597/g.233820  ORF Transcript_90597/g.233820 Transcript_90597/m.233820 type:complete len:223 (+) Transcript_90597:956-1624(+)
MLPSPFSSIILMMPSHLPSSSASCCFFVSICTFMSASLAAAAESTMTARMRFVRPSVTENRAPAKMTKVIGASLITGTAQAPQLSPATRVWNSSSTELKMEAKASSQSSFLLSGLRRMLTRCRIVTENMDQMIRSTNVMIRPQPMAFIAQKKPRIILSSSGNAESSREARTRRMSRSIRRNWKLVWCWSGAAISTPTSTQPTAMMIMSSQFQPLRKNRILNA